jgi:hypothetical protein
VSTKRQHIFWLLFVTKFGQHPCPFARNSESNCKPYESFRPARCYIADPLWKLPQCLPLKRVGTIRFRAIRVASAQTHKWMLRLSLVDGFIAHFLYYLNIIYPIIKKINDDTRIVVRPAMVNDSQRGHDRRPTRTEINLPPDKVSRTDLYLPLLPQKVLPCDSRGRQSLIRAKKNSHYLGSCIPKDGVGFASRVALGTAEASSMFYGWCTTCLCSALLATQSCFQRSTAAYSPTDGMPHSKVVERHKLSGNGEAAVAACVSPLIPLARATTAASNLSYFSLQSPSPLNSCVLCIHKRDRAAQPTVTASPTFLTFRVRLHGRSAHAPRRSYPWCLRAPRRTV